MPRKYKKNEQKLHINNLLLSKMNMTDSEYSQTYLNGVLIISDAHMTKKMYRKFYYKNYY